MSPNRLKNRDLWDITWLERQGVVLNAELVARKIADRHIAASVFGESLVSRIEFINKDLSIRKGFRDEMRRFLPVGSIADAALSDDYWYYLQGVIAEDLRGLAAVYPVNLRYNE